MTQTVYNLRKSEVPKYLHSSELYLSFSEDVDDEEITVAADCVKADQMIRTSDDVSHLLRTIRFWILPAFTKEFIEFLVKDRNKVPCCSETALQDFEFSFPGINDLLDQIHTDEAEPEQRVLKHTVCDVAARYGRLDFLEYFVNLGKPVTCHTLTVAATYGYMDCVRYVYHVLPKYENFQIYPRYYSVEKVIENGHFECLKFLIQHGFGVGHFNSWKTAAQAPSSAYFKYMLEVDPICDLYLLVYYAYEPVLQLLLQRGYSFSLETVADAASVGNMQCLQFMHTHCNLNYLIPSTMAAAAIEGQLQLIKQLHAQGCEWDDSALIATLRYNHLECFKFLINLRGIPSTPTLSTHRECCEVFMQYIDRKREREKEREEGESNRKRARITNSVQNKTP